MQFSLIPFISSFALTVIFLPLFIGFMRMKHEGQVIRDEGPKWHEKIWNTNNGWSCFYACWCYFNSMGINLAKRFE